MSHESQVISNKLGAYRLSPVVHRVLLMCSIICFLFSTMGCDAFVRKFTRKPKQENLPHEEVIVAPQKYDMAQLSKVELARQYFLFWKSWQDELSGALSGSVNHKRQVYSINQAINTLQELQGLLIDEKRVKLEIFLGQLKDLRESVIADVYGARMANNRLRSERIKSDILREFHYTKIGEYLL